MNLYIRTLIQYYIITEESTWKINNKFINIIYLDSKVHGANMGPIWGRQDPGGPHVGPMNFAIWVRFCWCGQEMLSMYPWFSHTVSCATCSISQVSFYQGFRQLTIIKANNDLSSIQILLTEYYILHVYSAFNRFIWHDTRDFFVNPSRLNQHWVSMAVVL